jgi:hypothetical protein
MVVVEVNHHDPEMRGQFYNLVALNFVGPKVILNAIIVLTEMLTVAIHPAHFTNASPPVSASKFPELCTISAG